MEIESPRIGKKMKLIGLSNRAFQANIFEGFYMGRNPIQTPYYQRLSSPEGHTFFSEHEGKQEIYCQRTLNLDLEYWCDGEDDPSYPVGIRVELVEGAQLNPFGLEYVRGKINELNKPIQ